MFYIIKVKKLKVQENQRRTKEIKENQRKTKKTKEKQRKTK